ncbi:HNH/Endo VII superfamily nuclease toxins [Bacillus sp. 166amftsu]|nr:HNH/Endo VII superfamily nuclease toxins [Bacillus sp. 166amftsu]
MVLCVTPVGKLAKMVKGVKMTADAVQAAKATENYKDHLERQGKLLTNNGAYRKARRTAGIPNSTPRKNPVQVFDGTTEHRWVEEYTNFKGEKVYIIEHREDKMGRRSHFHTADDEKGSPFEKEHIDSILDIILKILRVTRKKVKNKN